MTDRSIFTITGHANPTDLLTLADGQAVFSPVGASGLSGLMVNPVNDYGIAIGAGTGTANDAAMLAMFADLRTKATNVGTNYQGTIPIRFPAGYFEFNSTIELTDGTFIIEGASAAGPGGLGTVFKFPSGVTGIRVQRYNTSGASSTRTAARGADASIIRNLAIQGAYSSTEAEAHGIHLRASAHVENVFIANFEGDGIYSHVSAGSGGASEGNANNCRLYNVHIQGCRNGLNIDGADVNIWAALSCFFASNRQWGVWDSSFLGNSYFACQAEGNGIATGQLSVVHSGSNYYTVIRGQETGASTNAPSGTTADNTWWYYLGVGGGGYPAWTSGNTYRAGGSFLADDTGNANNLFSGCYHEGGQPWAQIVGPALVSGGSMRPSVKGVACLYGAGGGFGNLGWIGSSGGLLAGGNLQVFGSSHQIGPETGTAADNLLQLYNTNVTSGINGISTNGNIGNIDFNYGSGITYDVWNTGWSHRIRLNGTDALRIDASGLTVPEIASASVATPAASHQTLFIDTADHKLKRKDSGGTVTIIA